MAELRYKEKPRISSQSKRGGINESSGGDSIWKREIELSKSFSGKEKQDFFHLLCVLLDSGLSITESLEIIVGQTLRRTNRAIINAVLSSLQDGNPLSDSIEKQGKYFSRFEVFSIRMGERSGQVVSVLKDLAAYHEKRQRLKKKLVQALSYPIVVVLIAGGVLFFMIHYVVPMFSDIFARFDAELPAITNIVIGLSDFSAKWGFWLLLLMVLCFLLIYRVRDTDNFQKISSTVIMAVPVFGSVVHKIQLSRFCYALSLMLKSKVNLDQALELMEQVTTFWPIKRTVREIRKDVEEGKTFFEAIKAHRIFPPMMVQMVRVGEKTARLDSMMERVAINLEEEGEAGVNMVMSLVEPMLILILGLMVGLILVSMYLPMFELSNTIGG